MLIYYNKVQLVCHFCFLTTGENQIIRKGTNVAIFILGIHYDANVYPNPEKFDPERFAERSATSDERSPFAFIPFSAGSRNCIGSNRILHRISLYFSY